MKIAYIGQKGIPATFGGVEKYTEEVATRMAAKGHEVFVYVRNNYTDSELLEYKGTKLIHLPSISSKNLDAITHTFLATMHALFQGYDVVHYHSIGPTSMSLIFKIFNRRTKVVATHQCQDYNHQKWSWLAQKYLKFGEYVTCTVPDKTITISSALKKFILDNFGRQAILIPNGVSVSWTNQHDQLASWGLEPGKYIVSISRLIKHKNIHLLIEAFKNIQDKGLSQGMKLAIVGDGFHTEDYVARLKALAQDNQSIIFTGNLSGEALRQVFSHAFLFVQPSESEGMSLALLEAMGYGRAILASDIEENKNALDKLGFYFKSGSAVDLEKQLSRLLSHSGQTEAIGNAARNYARQNYNWDKIVNQIEQVYLQAIKGKPVARVGNFLRYKL